MMRLDRLVLLIYINMDLMAVESLKHADVGNEYWWAVFHAIRHYNEMDALIIDTQNYAHSVSLVPKSAVNKTIVTNHELNIFDNQEFKYLLEILNPKELVVFGVTPVDTLIGAVQWANGGGEDERHVIIRSDLCRYSDRKRDETIVHSLSKPPLVRIFPDDFISSESGKEGITDPDLTADTKIGGGHGGTKPR